MHVILCISKSLILSFIHSLEYLYQKFVQRHGEESYEYVSFVFLKALLKLLCTFPFCHHVCNLKVTPNAEPQPPVYDKVKDSVHSSE